MPSERDRLAGRRAALEARARVRRAVRAWFEGEGFLEVETPARVPAPGQEVHLDAIAAGADAVEGDDRWLVTSPEYHMKRLAAAGYQRIVQIGKAFRGGERGPHHQSEFTIIEWYRAGAPLEALARDCEQLLREAARAVGQDPAALGLAAGFERTTVRALLRRHAGVDLTGDESAAELRDASVAVDAVTNIVVYPSSGHRFDADPAAATDAWQRTLNWFDAHLR